MTDSRTNHPRHDAGFPLPAGEGEDVQIFKPLKNACASLVFVAFSLTPALSRWEREKGSQVFENSRHSAKLRVLRVTAFFRTQKKLSKLQIFQNLHGGVRLVERVEMQAGHAGVEQFGALFRAVFNAEFQRGLVIGSQGVEPDLQLRRNF